MKSGGSCAEDQLLRERDGAGCEQYGEQDEQSWCIGAKDARDSKDEQEHFVI